MIASLGHEDSLERGRHFVCMPLPSATGPAGSRTSAAFCRSFQALRKFVEGRLQIKYGLANQNSQRTRVIFAHAECRSIGGSRCQLVHGE